MIFSVTAGSDGAGLDRFSLYVPFTLTSGRVISTEDSTTAYEIDGYHIRLERLSSYYALTIGSFNTEEAARLYFPRMLSGLLWTSLKNKVGVIFPNSISETTLYPESMPVSKNSNFASVAKSAGWNAVEGHYDADKIVIRPETKKLIRWETGGVTVITGIQAASFFEHFSEALASSVHDRIINDEKLKLAIELYSSSYLEMTERAQFITLLSVLEALTPETQISDLGQIALNEAKNCVRKRCKDFKLDSGQATELGHLFNRLGNLRNQAITTSMREYVSGIVRQNLELGNPEEVSIKLRDIYKHRSLLLHTGSTDLGAVKEALQFLQSFVPSLLEHLCLVGVEK